MGTATNYNKDMGTIKGFIEAEPSNRVRYFDIARGIAMISIIAGHFDSTVVIRFVFTFHVPLFFIISGFFYKDDIKKVKQNAIKLLKPYVFTVACITCIELGKTAIKSVLANDKMWAPKCYEVIAKNIVAGLYGSGSRTDFLGYSLPAIGAIWFLLALIWAQLAVFVINAFARRNSASKFIKIISGTLCWLIGFLSARITWLPASIQAGLCSVLFIYAGVWLKNKNWTMHIQKQRHGEERGLFFALVCAWLVAIFFSFYNENMSLVRCCFPNPFVNVIGAIAATHVICIGSSIIENTIVADFLELMGRDSLIVLSFHLMELNTFPWDKIVLNRVPNMFAGITIVLIMKICWCVMGIWAVHNNKWLKRVFS